MIKLLFRIAIFLVLGILIYNRFFGTPEEKAHSKAIIAEAKALGKASWALLKSEKEKLNQGKYDTALDRIETLADRVAAILATHAGATLSLRGLRAVSPAALAKLRDNPGIELPRRLTAARPSRRP